MYRPLGLHGTHLPQGHRLPEPHLHGYAVDPPAPPEDASEAVGASGSWAPGGTVSAPGYTQLAAATSDGTRSLTFSATSQIPLDAALLARTRALQEDFVCALLRD